MLTCKVESKQKVHERGRVAVTYSAWFVVSRDADGREWVLAYRNGSECMVPATKRGIPQQACAFETQQAAEREASFLFRYGFYPLVGTLRAKQISWR